MRSFRAILVAVVLVAVVGPATAGGVQTPPDKRGETTLRVGAATRPDSLNPLVASNRLGRVVTSLLYDELLPTDENQQALPALIHDWTRSNDGRLWLLDIRAGSRWSDGAAVTARDVIHTLKRIKSGPPNRFSRWLVDVTRIQRFGRLRVGIRLARPADSPPALPIPVLPRHVWQTVQAGDVADFANDPPIGSGAFAAESASEGDTLLFTARKNHWQGPPTVDQLALRFYDSQEALAAALEANEIDVADDLDPSQLTRLGDIPGVAVRATESTAFVSLGMNTGATDGNGSTPLRETRVRRAIAHALDREMLKQAALTSYGQTGSTIVPLALPAHAEPRPGTELSFDPNRAARLFDRAGLTDRDGDGIRDIRSGTPFALRLYTRVSLPETQELGDLIASELSDLGIDMKVEALTDRELSRRIRSGRYDLFVWGWDVGTDPAFIASVLTCGQTRPGGLSDTYFCDGEYESLYKSLRSAETEQERQSLLEQLQQRAYERVPYVVLYYRPTFQAFRDDRFVAPADELVPVVFGSAPHAPVNLELASGQVPGVLADAEGSAAPVSAPTSGLFEEIRSSLLWQLLAAAALAVLALLLLPRIVRFVLRSRRSRRERRAEDAAPEAESAESTESDDLDADTGELPVAMPPSTPRADDADTDA